MKGSEIKDYYAELEEKSAQRSEVSDLDDRIIYAINLNKFENENLYGICYRIAQYCFDHKIKIIAREMENSLLALTAVICEGPVKVHKKPVLLIEKLLPSIISKSASGPEEAINKYGKLQFLGLQIRNALQGLPHVEFTMDDYWEFICYDYNVFNLYQNIHWDSKGQTISALRKIVKIVAVKPLD